VKRTTNEGAQALVPYVAERGQKAELADGMGVDRGMVTRWVSGEQKPGTKYRLELKDRYGIDISSWDREVPRRKAA
jgi:transcriptional regulator with XRE-family HTH domain